LDIVFEDEDMAVIIKPAGINVSGNQFKTVQNALNYNLTPSSKIDKLPWPLPVHRLDNQTSGLLIIAKTKGARIQLGKDFENKTITKHYHALVIGQLLKTGTISAPVDGKKSDSLYTSIRTVKSLKNEWISLIELSPLTGRTHQLRIHCSSIGHPILGDKLYGDEGMILKAKGLFLAAIRLTLNHPISGEPLQFEIPTPYKFIKRLENEERRFNAKI